MDGRTDALTDRKAEQKNSHIHSHIHRERQAGRLHLEELLRAAEVDHTTRVAHNLEEGVGEGRVRSGVEGVPVCVDTNRYTCVSGNI